MVLTQRARSGLRVLAVVLAVAGLALTISAGVDDQGSMWAGTALVQLSLLVQLPVLRADRADRAARRARLARGR